MGCSSPRSGASLRAALCCAGCMWRAWRAWYAVDADDAGGWSAVVPTFACDPAGRVPRLPGLDVSAGVAACPCHPYFPLLASYLGEYGIGCVARAESHSPSITVYTATP